MRRLTIKPNLRTACRGELILASARMAAPFIANLSWTLSAFYAFASSADNYLRHRVSTVSCEDFEMRRDRRQRAKTGAEQWSECKTKMWVLACSGYGVSRGGDLANYSGKDEFSPKAGGGSQALNLQARSGKPEAGVPNSQRL